MLFKYFKTVVGRDPRLGQLKSLFDHAQIIRTDFNLHDFFKAHPMGDTLRRKALKKMALPHYAVWIEDDASGVLLVDMEKGAVGGTAQRMCMDCQHLGASREAFNPDYAPKDAAEAESYFREYGIVTLQLNSFKTKSGKKYKADMNPLQALKLEGDVVLERWEPPAIPSVIQERMLTRGGQNVIAALELLMYLADGRHLRLNRDDAIWRLEAV